MAIDEPERPGISRKDDFDMTIGSINEYIDERGGVEGLSPAEANNLRELVEAQVHPETLDIARKFEANVRARAERMAEEDGIPVEEAEEIITKLLLDTVKALKREE